MSILGDRIKKERENLNLTRDELAQKLDVSYSAIAMYEQGHREPNNELTLKMCELFDCSMDYLIGESEFKNVKQLKEAIINEYEKNFYYIDLNNAIIASTIYFVNSELTPNDRNKIKDFLQEQCSYNIDFSILENFIKTFPPKKQVRLKEVLDKIIENINSYREDRESYSDFKELIKDDSSNIYMAPVYGRIAAGQPNWAEECIEGRLPIDPELMNITNPEECYFLRVNGESMNKIIKNGAYALIRKTDFVENGEIAVVLVNGNDATLKKFSKQEDLIILEPMSTDSSFSTQVYNKDTQIKVIGKYIGKMEMD